MGKKNAKEEFLNVIKGCKVIAASISFGDYDDKKEFKLKPLYTKEEYENFLIFMDRKYDSGYGGQELFGIIYCENGVWMERGEWLRSLWDGSEWWETHKYPDMKTEFGESIVLKYERNRKLKILEDL